MCVQCGCINDGAGSAIAWAETGARQREKELSQRLDSALKLIDALSQRITHLENYLYIQTGYIP